MGMSHRESSIISLREKRLLAAIATPPNRAYRVDDIPRRQPKARRQHRVAWRTRSEGHSSSGELWSCTPMDGAIYTTATREGTVSRIYNCVGGKGGDIGADDLNHGYTSTTEVPVVRLTLELSSLVSGRVSALNILVARHRLDSPTTGCHNPCFHRSRQRTARQPDPPERFFKP